MEYDIFISYSRRDIEQVKRIKEEIENTADISCWMDMDGIESGAQFEDVIISAIDNSQIVLLMLSESSMQSKWAKDEVRYAYSTEKKVVPLHIDSSELTGWFLFKFSGMDVIDYSNTNQKKKFLDNLLSWTGKISHEQSNICVKAADTELQVIEAAEQHKIVDPAQILQSSKVKFLLMSGLFVIVLAIWGLVSLKSSSQQDVETFTVNDVSFDMVLVNGGTFTMGATQEMQDARDNERPSHQVTLTNNYYIGKTEVTQSLWKAVMGSNPSSSQGDNKPVENISWNDCQTFILKLNSLTGKNFRLPTEAEWEFAARGGNKTLHYQYSGSDNLNSVAWYESNSDNCTHDVATKQPNEIGIYDMSGNVWEWCSDKYGMYNNSSQINPNSSGSGSDHVYRGGCMINKATRCRSSYRCLLAPDFVGYGLGLRLALSE